MAFLLLCGEGMRDNSPAIQGWVSTRNGIGPERTIEGVFGFGRPFGTEIVLVVHPALKRWASLISPSGTTHRLGSAVGQEVFHIGSKWWFVVEGVMPIFRRCFWPGGASIPICPDEDRANMPAGDLLRN